MCDSYPPKNSFIQFNLSIRVFGNYLLVMLQALLMPGRENGGAFCSHGV